MSGRPKLLAGERLSAEPQQRRSVEKRARLKKAGLALFGEKGYEGTSVEDIAQRARLAVGGFYLHFRSKRQLLLVLMDELLEKLAGLDLRPHAGMDARAGLHALLAGALATTTRVHTALELLLQLPGARSDVDVAGLARVLDDLFWNLLARANQMSEAELTQWTRSATHLVYHALFRDSTASARSP